MDLRSLSEMLPRSQWRSLCATRSVPSSSSRSHHCTTQTGGSACGPEGQRSAPSGSRRAATGVRNNRRVCSETMKDHDRRFWHRWPLTWRSSHAFTVLNTTQFHARRLGTDLARRKPGVQIPRLHPTTQQVRASSEHHRRRSRCSPGCLGPHLGHARTAEAAEPRCHPVPAGRCRRARPDGRGAQCRPPGTGGRNGPG
jgi:hypothetical protein